MSFPASTLRAGAVLSPDFPVRNMVRDQFSAFVNSKYGFVPVVDTLRGLFHAVKKDEVYWQWMNSGGAMSTLVSLDREYLQRNLRQLMRKSAKNIAALSFNPKNYINLLRTLTEYGELGTRLGESDLRKKEREIQNNRTMTPERKRAALNALDKQSVNVARKALKREGI
ncbi:hypothetical protein [Desulforamulus ruminis]|uniref:hypothetical protein n=1 Tax=Desulforamulus ruminis TaxID=1564 RepID=UPI00030C8B4D|nr:hypothetical protein [Desulforamulus ruminis]